MEPAENRRENSGEKCGLCGLTKDKGVFRRMAQTNPSYLYATGKCEKPIIDALVQKYGASNISWPIVLLENDRTAAYLYE